MIIHVEDLKFQCIIGILDFERTSPQDVIVNLTIDYNNENGFINYADIVQIIKENMIKSEFLLIEDALDSLNLKLVKEFSSIKSLDLKITKPSILPDCKVSVSNHYKYQS
ncbi:MAG: dihydroneopterin aldolase [Sulfurimonas sp.]|nr:dihydroneopterin aldolase [Sulfurimonas sp.]